MKDFLLCVAAGCLLLWIIYLKLEIGALEQTAQRFLGLLKRHLERMTGDVEVTRVLKAWGKKVQLEEEDLSWVQKRNDTPTKPMGGF